MRENSYRRGYNKAWAKARAGFLRSHPLCKMCEQIGRLTPAEVVDHIVPHRGDRGLFWDRDNWQALCKVHHDSTKQRAEQGDGIVGGCDESGYPLDSAHHWNKPALGK